jgi:hypothetical protein
MKTASAKAKSRRLQTWVAKKIGELTLLPVGKDCDIESRPMGQSGADIRLSEKARELFPFTTECKNTEKWELPKAIRQCKANLYPNTDWLIFFDKNDCKDHKSPIVVLDAAVFFSILQRSGEENAEKKIKSQDKKAETV